MRGWIAGVALTLGLAAQHQAASACQLGLVAEVPLTSAPGRELVTGEINDHPVTLIVDTGAFFSSLPYHDAERLGVNMYKLGTVMGVGGGAQAGEGTAKLKIGAATFAKKPFVVLSMGSLDHGAAGLLGRELLMQYDLEIDAPEHRIRLLQEKDCRPADLVYWNQPYSQVALEAGGSNRPEILFDVKLNGRTVLAQLDSGFSRTTITSGAAHGVDAPISQMDDENKVGGIGSQRVSFGVAALDSVTIGDETVKNVRTEVSDLWHYNREAQMGSLLGGVRERSDSPRMMVGDDFLKSHHVLISPKSGVMVFSYVGGPVFAAPRVAEAKAQSSGPTPPTAPHP